MPSIESRMVPDEDALEFQSPAKPQSDPVPRSPVGPPTPVNSLMAVGGNSVPMHGILPIEQMTDTDLYRFFPYSAYSDRIWKYTYFSLFNTAR